MDFTQGIIAWVAMQKEGRRELTERAQQVLGEQLVVRRASAEHGLQAVREAQLVSLEQTRPAVRIVGNEIGKWFGRHAKAHPIHPESIVQQKLSC